jgi:RNA recognition motif-containing protein
MAHVASSPVLGTKLFVGCLPYSKTDADLMSIFSQFGPTQEVAILKQLDGTSKGAAFVTYRSPHHALTAMSTLQNYTFPGCNRGIRISMATGGGAGGAGFGGSAQQSGATLGGTAGCKVFVGQLPYSKSEHDLVQLFSAMGPVIEVTLLKDKITQEKKGCAFVRFASSHRAQAAVSALNGFTFNGSPRPITVSIAAKDFCANPNPTGAKRAWNGQGAGMNVIHQMGQLAPAAMQLATSGQFSGPEGAKIFVGQLPFSQGEASIAEAFSKFGPVEEVFLHKDAQGHKKGACFVRYYDVDHAMQALSMNGYLFQGATRPITVQLASESKRRRVNM